MSQSQFRYGQFTTSFTFAPECNLNYTLRWVVLRYYWNTDDTDWADFHGFFFEIQEKSVKIRLIGVISVPIVSKTTRRKVYKPNTQQKMFFLTIASTILVAFGVQKMWFMPMPKGIRVLMYHKISVHEKSDLTITCEQLDSHLNYLQKNDYQFITTQQVIDFYVHQKTLPPNPILLTFDDGYENVFQDAYPILKKYDAKATLFITTAFVGGINAWDRGNDKIMALEQLKKLDTAIFELGLHSHHHQNYKQLSLQQIENDLQTNIDFFKNNHLNYTPAFAYPYGGCPKNAAPAFKKWGIQMAFRIGNKVNHFKTNDLYALKRIDVKGTDDFDTFKLKVKKGRTKLIL